jgi:hypothetical protein
VSYFIALRNGSPVRTVTASARGLVRLAAIAAVLVVAIHPSATNAAAFQTEADRADTTPVLAIGTWSANDGSRKAAGHGFDADDGEDQFDEGDDEFDCDNVDEGEDACENDPGDSGDEEVDENEAGCANFDDGNDRCLDDGQDHLDEGDDEFGAQPAPTDTRISATSAAAPLDLSAPGALAAVIGLGAGSVWLLRRART